MQIRTKFLQKIENGKALGKLKSTKADRTHWESRKDVIWIEKLLWRTGKNTFRHKTILLKEIGYDEVTSFKT